MSIVLDLQFFGPLEDERQVEANDVIADYHIRVVAVQKLLEASEKFLFVPRLLYLGS